MSNEKLKELLDHTECHLTKHLEDLNDVVFQNNGRIKDHMVLEGLAKCVHGLKDLRDLKVTEMTTKASNAVSISSLSK